MLKTIADKFLSSCVITDRGGNFAMMTAILLPVSIGGAGIAIDLTSAMQAKNNLQNIADAAALSAASAMSSKNLTEEAGKTIGLNEYVNQGVASIAPEGATAEELAALKKDLIAGTSVSVKKLVSDLGEVSYSVTLTSNHDIKLSTMTSLLGMKTMKVSMTSTAEASTESKNAFSMFLVLDRSGSMAWDTNTVNASQPTRTVTYDCSYWTNKGKYVSKSCEKQETNYIIKIDALKSAVASLLGTISKADPDKKYARAGAVSYNYAMDSAQSLQWGTDKALSYTNALVAQDGTSSTAAFKKAYDSLIATTENEAHKTKNGKTPSKFIVFMTDGDNNYTSDDTNTLTHCKSAKTAGVEVYSVAFMAPSRGQDLLKKCSTDDKTHYFAAESADELIAAFKAIGEKASQTSTRLTN